MRVPLGACRQCGSLESARHGPPGPRCRVTAPNDTSRPTTDAPATAVSDQVTRVFFVAGAFTTLAATLVVRMFYVGVPAATLDTVAWIGAGMALVYALAGWLSRPHRATTGMVIALLGSQLGLLAIAIVTGLGVHMAGLGLLALLVMVAGIFLNLRVAVLLTVVAAAGILVLAQLEAGGRLATPPGVSQSMMLNRMLSNLMGVACGLAFAWALARYTARTLRLATEQQARFATLLGIMADWYWEQDEHFRFTRVSESFQRAIGLPSTDYIGRRRWDVPDLDVTPEQWAAHLDDLENHRPFRDFIMRKVTPDGREVVAAISGEPVFDAQGRFRGYWGVGRNVTAEHESRRALAASEQRYRNLFARSPSAMVIHRDGRIVSCNDAALRLMGCTSADELVGTELLDLYDAPSRLRVEQRLRDVEHLPLGQTLPVVDLVLRRRDGRLVDVSATGCPVELPEGRAVESIYIDVTERRQAESALLQSEAMLSGLFVSSPDVITVTDPVTGRYVMTNPQFTRIIGYTAEEAIGRTVIELGMLDSQADRRRFLDEIERQGWVRDLPMRYRTKDGRLVSMLITGTIFSVGDTRYLLVLSRDVSEIERTQAEYKAILDNASVGIALVREGRLRRVNASFETMLGWPPGSLVDRPVRDIWPDATEYERARALTRSAFRRPEGIDFEWQMQRRDGSRFWARSRASHVHAVGTARRDSIWIVEDITAARRAADDLAAARDQAEAASRAKSAFLANMSHEIRTPLHGVLGLAQLAAMPGVDETRRTDYLHRIVDSAQALSGVISDILDLSKIEAGRLVLEAIDFDLREMIQALHGAHAELAAGRGLELGLSWDDDVPARVTGDPVRTRQILANFLSNAVKFTETGRIDLAVHRRDERCLRFEVRDTGPGIAPGLQARLFKPFTQADDSTTRRYGGTGLGLSICRELAHLMGGEVGVDSQPGRGSCFWADLPLATAAAAAPTAPAGAPSPDGLRGARILVVEDNAVNMLIAVSMLEMWGVDVVQARNGQEAVAIVDREQGAFDAVLMDVHMPGMSGYEATQALRRRYDAARLPIIALTAAALVSEQERTRRVGMNAFLAKPIDVHGLYATLRRFVRT